jgi:hypothetical protein
MARKKYPTTVTPAEARRSTIIHKDLTKLFTLFRELNIPEGEEGLNPTNMAVVMNLYHLSFVSEICCNVIPLRKRVKFLQEADKLMFKSHKRTLKETLPILWPELKDKF